MTYKESALLLLVAFFGLTKATCSVKSSEEKAEAKDDANYKVNIINEINKGKCFNLNSLNV